MKKTYYFEEVPKEQLPKGVTFKLIVRHGEPSENKFGQAPNHNKFAHLVDPDSRRGEEARWV